MTQAYEWKLDIKICPPEFLRKLSGSVLGKPPVFDSLEDFDIAMHLEKDFYYNPSLYQRSWDDFAYTLIIFELITTKEYFENVYPPASSSIPYDPEKYMAMMIDEQGNFKPAGLGGPEKGEWGDTIWNTIREIEETASDK